MSDNEWLGLGLMLFGLFIAYLLLKRIIDAEINELEDK